MQQVWQEKCSPHLIPERTHLSTELPELIYPSCFWRAHLHCPLCFHTAWLLLVTLRCWSDHLGCCAEMWYGKKSKPSHIFFLVFSLCVLLSEVAQGNCAWRAGEVDGPFEGDVWDLTDFHRRKMGCSYIPELQTFICKEIAICIICRFDFVFRLYIKKETKKTPKPTTKETLNKQKNQTKNPKPNNKRKSHKSKQQNLNNQNYQTKTPQPNKMHQWITMRGKKCIRKNNK